MGYMDDSAQIDVFIFVVIVYLPARLTNWSLDDHVIRALASIVNYCTKPIDCN
jgi:hypothetical protein